MQNATHRVTSREFKPTKKSSVQHPGPRESHLGVISALGKVVQGSIWDELALSDVMRWGIITSSVVTSEGSHPRVEGLYQVATQEGNWETKQSKEVAWRAEIPLLRFDCTVERVYWYHKFLVHFRGSWGCTLQITGWCLPPRQRRSPSINHEGWRHTCSLGLRKI